MNTQTPGANRRFAANPAEVAVAFRNVTQYFDSLWGGKQVRALVGADFEVRRGEVFGLLGPARSGKSTAIKLMAGQLRPMEGSIKVFGLSPARRSVRARIGWLPQGTPAGAAAQLLLKNVELAVLDEPFVDLVPPARAEFKRLFSTLAREGVTVIIASQKLAELKDLCDRVAVFADGKVEAVGAIAALLDSPKALPWLLPTLPASISEMLLAATRTKLESIQSLDTPWVDREAVRGDSVLVRPQIPDAGLTFAKREAASEELIFHGAFSSEKSHAACSASEPRVADSAAAAAEKILERLVKAPAENSR